MAVVGLVLVVDPASELAALASLAALPGLSLGERRGARVAAVLRASDRDARDVLESAADVPGVLAVLPVFHALDAVLEASALEDEEER